MSREQSALLLFSLSIGLALAVDICEYQMDGVHLAHPADCSKFVVCQNGKTYRISSCPLGLHFNRFKGACDLRQRAACDIEFVNFASEEANCSACCSLYGCYVNPECPETPGTITTVITPSTTLIPETQTPTTEESTELPVTLSTPATTEITSSPTSNPTNTTSSPATVLTPSTALTPETTTTEESTEIPVTLSTPTTTEITGNPVTNTPSSPFTPASPDTPATPDVPKTKQCANNLTICQEESDNSAMHVNGTCNQYIVCVAGCAYIMSCPANLQYDIVKQVCDYPQNVDCPWQSTTAIAGPSGLTCSHHGQCEKQRDGKLFVNPNTDGYIICQCECEIERPCPDGTKFDAQLLTCAWKANRTESENGKHEQYSNDGKTGNTNEHGKDVNNSTADETADGSGNTNSPVCSNNIEICKNQSEGTLFAVDGVCNKFYKCNFGCAVEILCPTNLVYNPLVKYCDSPYNYKCPWPLTAPAESSAGPSGIACASGGRCSGQLDGTLLPSSTSCTKYVVCQCECEVERDCAKNLYWDRNLLTCNYPANVTCDLNV